MKRLGIIDADLIDNGTRHPNLACMKISAYYKEKGWNVKLLESYDNLDKYDLVSISRVFSFTKVPNSIYKDGRCVDVEHPEIISKLVVLVFIMIRHQIFLMKLNTICQIMICIKIIFKKN